VSILPGSNYRLKIIFEKKRRHMSCLCLRVLLLVLLLLLLGADDTIIMLSNCFGGRFGGGVSVVGAFRLVPSSAINPLAYRKRIVSSGIANNMNIINHRHQFLKQTGIFVGQTKLFATTTSPSKFSESYGNLTKAEQDAVRLQTNIRTDIRNWRKQLSTELQKPPYKIARNSVVEEVARQLPTNEQELLKISGIGPKSLSYAEKYLGFVKARTGFSSLSIEQLRHANKLPGVIAHMTLLSAPKPAISDEDAEGTTASDDSVVAASLTEAENPKQQAVKRKSSASTKPKASGKASSAAVTKTTARSSTDQQAIFPSVSFSENGGVDSTAGSDEGPNSVSNAEQQEVIERVLSTKRNFFISGSAGTGKSFLLKHLIHELKRIYNSNSGATSNNMVDKVAVTAPTGIAAINVGGVTVHSFVGIGLGVGDANTLLTKVLKNPLAVRRWQQTQVLVIDEISMIDINTFQLLDTVAKTIRKNTLPFGGIRVIACGDFCQLPPVVSAHTQLYEQLVADRLGPAFTSDNTNDLMDLSKAGRHHKHTLQHFCFESLAWNDLGLNNVQSFCELKTVVRQSNINHAELLNRIRTGRCTDADIQLLNQHYVKYRPMPTDDIVPTKIYCVNKDVDSENKKKLDALSGDLVTVSAWDKWIIAASDSSDPQQAVTSQRARPGAPGSEPQSHSHSASLRKAIHEAANKRIAPTLDLKIGAQVMLLRNIGVEDEVPAYTSGENGSNGNKPLANGSRGVVIGFTEPTNTISNIKDKDGTNNDVNYNAGLIPIVKFDNGRTEKINRMEYVFSSIDAETGDEVSLMRYQLPLKLAW
jgi:nucleoside-triphosphatase THEP1